MTKRGRKPVNMGLLNTWEHQFFMAFHNLCDGHSLPPEMMPADLLPDKPKLRNIVTQLQNIKPEQYWLSIRRIARDEGEKINLNRPPSRADLEWAAKQLAQSIYWLKRELNPPAIRAQLARRKIWNDLISAENFAALKKACGRWARLPDIQGSTACFPKHIVLHADQFFRMKHNKRFPKSSYSNNSRIEYLARGMAGVMADASAMTGIERLRNMKHAKGGPFWHETCQECRCWKCSILTMRKYDSLTISTYPQELDCILDVASRIKVPREWEEQNIKRKYHNN